MKSLNLSSVSQFLSSPFERAHFSSPPITECALHIEMWEPCQRKLNCHSSPLPGWKSLFSLYFGSHHSELSGFQTFSSAECLECNLCRLFIVPDSQDGRCEFCGNPFRCSRWLEEGKEELSKLQVVLKKLCARIVAILAASVCGTRVTGTRAGQVSPWTRVDQLLRNPLGGNSS